VIQGYSRSIFFLAAGLGGVALGALAVEGYDRYERHEEERRDDAFEEGRSKNTLLFVSSQVELIWFTWWILGYIEGQERSYYDGDM
jgi:hypothetical protein